MLSHLPPASLSAIALVCHRFHALVTTPHAWRAAFSRYFPGASLLEPGSGDHESAQDIVQSERRSFTRLTSLASWRSEYILRTKLLRAVERGKPSAPTDGMPVSRTPSAQITYNSNAHATVNRIDAAWDAGSSGKLAPRFIHGSDDDGCAWVSDAAKATPGPWGSADWRMELFFEDSHPGTPLYGLGPGEVVGVPNVLDVSQKHGMFYAEGMPNGRLFFRSTDEKRGRDLLQLQVHSSPERGVPNLDADRDTPCCVWIAKNNAIPTLSNGVIGLLSGSSYGIITAHSLGTTGLRERRIERGEPTARWVLSPGVPIVAMGVDEDYSVRRAQAGRIWAVALNALGEVFYLNDLPKRHEIPLLTKLGPKQIDELAWETARTVHWTLIEPTRRRARPDPHQISSVDRAYTPRGSWNGTGLSEEEIVKETREIQVFAMKRPKHFREICEGWDMQRRLVVDFAHDDGNDASEGILVFDCGLESDIPAGAKRFTRVRGALPGAQDRQSCDFGPTDFANEETPASPAESWLISTFAVSDIKSAYFTTTVLDTSKYAALTAGEDPLLSFSISANTSPLSTPSADMPPLTSRTDIPGQRARLVAAGTSTGTIILWDARAPNSAAPELANTVSPVAVIRTDSPQISCLGLTGFYLVHGGNDGLVQAWDPLRSTTRPLRTLNSRFSSRARRRLVQASAHPRGIGVNLFAAGAICLDPDPTSLRGIVSLGTHLRYWSFGTEGVDSYRRAKRRVARRADRGNAAAGGTDRYTATGRGALLEQIEDEARDFRLDEKERRQHRARLQSRFGVGLLGQDASDAEVLAYATLLSEEAARDNAQRRSSGESGPGHSPADVAMGRSPPTTHGAEGFDVEMAAAIRLSLEESSSAGEGPSSPSVGAAGSWAGSSPREGRLQALEEEEELEELEFVRQLSLAEEESRRAASLPSSPPDALSGRSTAP